MDRVGLEAGKDGKSGSIYMEAYGLSPIVCVKFLEDALGQKLPRRPKPGPGEQLTVFQFWSYIETVDSPSMEAYVTEMAEEGMARTLIPNWTDPGG